MRKEHKAEVIEALSERLASSDTVIAADYRGLTVGEMGELRARLAGAETTFTVVKNTLARRAAAASGREALVPYLDGPTGIAWVAGDPAAAAKALHQFAGEHAERFAVKGGLLEGEDLPAEAFTRLARLPSREQLLAQLAGGVAAPLTGLAGGLGNLIGGLARSLGALQAQRESAAAES